MTHKKDIIKQVSDKLNLSEVKTKEVIQLFLDTVVDTLIKDGRLELRGLGVFEVKQRKAKTFRNIHTHELCQLEAYKDVEYKTSKVIKTKLNTSTSIKITTKIKPKPTFNWINFEKDFISFLFDFKISNQTRPKLRIHGQLIKEDLQINPEYKSAFNKICEKLPDNILKHFKSMYLQGYFYLYESEIIEISKQEAGDKILLLLYESLRQMGTDEPVKEAKKVLGFKDF